MANLRHTIPVTVCLAFLSAGPSQANWSETFDGGLGLATWQFQAYPQVTGTFSGTIETGPDGNSYLALTETQPPAVGGSGFGMAFASQEQFSDVCPGAVVNVTGDASHSYHGLGARILYFIDDGKITGAPGLIASG